MNIFDSKHPDQIRTPFVALVTFAELFRMHTILNAMEPGERREAMFMQFMVDYGIDQEVTELGIEDEIDLIDLTITDGGLNEKPPKRVMSLSEYREYWNGQAAKGTR
jgi:hypothetical protein